MSIKLKRFGEVTYINDHDILNGRDKPNQHPISAIEGLRSTLDSKYEKPISGIPDTDLELRYLTEDLFDLYKASVEKKHTEFYNDISKLRQENILNTEDINNMKLDIINIKNDISSIKSIPQNPCDHTDYISTNLNIKQETFIATDLLREKIITIDDTDLSVIKPTILYKNGVSNDLALEGIDYNVSYLSDTQLKITFLKNGEYLINYASGVLSDSEYNILSDYIEKIKNEFIKYTSGSYVNPSANVIVEYDSFNRVIKETYVGEVNKEINYQYDINNNICRKIVVSNNYIKTATYTYDEENKLINVIDEGTEVPIDGTAPKKYECDLIYDVNNFLLKEIYTGEINKLVEYTHNKYGDILTKSVTEDNITRVARYTYDGNRKLIKIEDEGIDKVAVVFKESPPSISDGSDSSITNIKTITELDIDLIFSTIFI